MGKTRKTGNLVSENIITADISGVGSVGIGTTRPKHLLDISGDINFTGNLLKNSVVYSPEATYASNAGYSTSAGISTYATSAGIATYATTAGVATYASTAGIATYATTAGVATNAQGLTGTPNISVGTITATGNVSVGGTLTYEDVTNVDSIGFITARTGINVVGGGMTVTGISTFYNNVVTTGYFTDSIGNVRSIPLKTESSSSSYTLIASDAGKTIHVHSTTNTVVVPNSVFSAGDAVSIVNGDGSNTPTIQQGSGFALRNTGDGSTGNRTLGVFGMATIYFTGAGVGYISGSGMS